MARKAAIQTPEAAYEEAVKLLARKARTVKEVADELAARGATDDDVQSVLGRLKAHRHLDDAELASDEAYALVECKGLAPALAVQMLEGRGIASRLAREAVDAARDGRAERELCAAALAKRLRGRAIGAAAVAKEGRALARLGYDEEVVAAALEKAVRGAMEDEA